MKLFGYSFGDSGELRVNMGKSIKSIMRVFIFLVIICLLIVWLSYLLRPIDVYRTVISGYYAEPKDTLDAVYIGGSVCFKYWMPLTAWNEHGYTSYNFSTDALPPQLIKYYVTEALKTQSPRLFIIDVRPFEFGDVKIAKDLTYMYREAALRRGIDSFNYSLNRADMIKNCVPDEQLKLEYYFDIIKYHANFDQLSAESFRYSFNKRKNYTKGYTVLAERADVVKNDFSDISELKPITPNMEGLLIDLTDHLERLDIKALFIVAPYPIYVENDQKVHNYMGEIITERGFDFLDCNKCYDDIGLDFETDFYDNNHVNVLGALKYTQFLSGYLHDRYEFEDKRNDPAYASWHEDYRLFSKDIDKAAGEIVFARAD